MKPFPLASVQSRRTVPEYSIELGRTSYGPDYLDSTAVPSNGFLFSLWGQRTDAVGTGGYPWSSGNREFFDFYFSNWTVRVIGWNSSAASSGDTNCNWNSNSMIMLDGTAVGEPANSYAGDYSYMSQGGFTVPQIGGWVFHAMQVWNDSANSQIILRLWVKFYGSAVLGPFTTTLSYAQLRLDIVANSGWTTPHANAFTPSTTPSRFVIGSDQDDGRVFALHGRMETNTGTPTNSYIETIAALTAPDTGAWADWQLNWTGGAANVSDRSGHARPLTIHSGGTLYQGPLGPF